MSNPVSTSERPCNCPTYDEGVGPFQIHTEQCHPAGALPPRTEYISLADFPRKLRELADSISRDDCDSKLQLRAYADMLERSIADSVKATTHLLSAVAHPVEQDRLSLRAVCTACGGTHLDHSVVHWSLGDELAGICWEEDHYPMAGDLLITRNIGESTCEACRRHYATLNDLKVAQQPDPSPTCGATTKPTVSEPRQFPYGTYTACCLCKCNIKLEKECSFDCMCHAAAESRLEEKQP